MSEPFPRVSVVVPVLDGDAHLGRCLESLLAQTVHDIEVIVVDDGSRDRTVEVASSYPVRVVRRPHAGVSAARNAGIAASRAPLVGFCDHDDEWRPDLVAVQLDHLGRNPEASAILCRQLVVLAPGVERPTWLVRDERGELGGVHPLSGLFRHDALDEIGGFDEELHGNEDFDLLVRLREHGHHLSVIDEQLLVRHVHDGNLSHATETYAPGMLEALRRHARRVRA